MRVNFIATIHFLENPSTELLVMLESEFVKQLILEHKKDEGYLANLLK